MGKGIGGFVSGIFGSENEERAKGRQVNSNNYNYGGSETGAEDQAKTYTQQGAGSQDRQATQADVVNIDYSQANDDRNRNLAARDRQVSIADIMQSRAMGGQPTVAQMQADRQMQQARAQQASMAGGARGAGGLAAAQRTAAFNTANTASDISGQAQINAAQERRDDTNAAAGMWSNVRGGDLASQGQVAGQAQAQAQLGAQQNQFNAGLRDMQSGRNDARQLSYDQLANQVRTTQLGARTNYEAQQSANDLGAQGINAQIAGQNAAMNQKNGEGVVSMLGKGAGIIAGALAKGGPAHAEKAYLVGEEGPELVVPRDDGYVLTAGQTKQALAHSPSSTINRLFDRGDQHARTVSLSQVMGARMCGGPIQARADGGPIDGIAAGTMAPPPAEPPAGYQPPMSTWGTGQPDATAYSWQAAQDQQARMQPYDDLSARIADQRQQIGQTQDRVNSTVADIDEKDKNAVWENDYKARHHQKTTQAEDDAAEEARYRQDLDKKQARTDAKAKRKKSLSDVLSESGDEGMKNASRIDTSYHGGGGYVPPQLIQIAGARAMGGLISPGLVPIGPHRPDEAMPMLGPGSGAGATSYEVLDGTGGEDVAASGKAMSDFATKYTKSPGAGPTGYGGAREDGGPVEGSDDDDNPTYRRGIQEGREQQAKDYLRSIDHRNDQRADARDNAAEEWARDLAYAGGAGVGNPAVGAVTQAPMLANYVLDKAEAYDLRSGDKGVPEKSAPGVADNARGEGRAVVRGEAGASAYVPAERDPDRKRAPVKDESTRAGVAKWINSLLARRGR